MKLRPYQQEIVNQIYDSWAKGYQNVGVRLPTGAGKTVVFSHILSNHRGQSIAIAHRMELVSQIALTLAQHGIYHNIIAQKQTIRNIIALQVNEVGRSFYNIQAPCRVAGVDTLIRLDPSDHPWMKSISLVVQDEGHHVLKKNKWGIAAMMFPTCKGLYPTATPLRADGNGLGRNADGVLDILLHGPTMRELIDAGYLTDYRLIVPATSDLDLSDVPITAAGDYSPVKLRGAVHRSHVVGDVVKHYIKFASGKLGITFAVDLESAQEITLQFKNSGIPAEMISSKTPDLLRAQLIRRFRNREVMQLVNVDLLGEGVDVPAIEVISMARPTQSYGLYCQQFGRALRPLEGKKHAIIMDHVGNILRHGLPDISREWTLDRRDRKSATKKIINLKTCLNPECLAAYERIHRICPHCGFYNEPVKRSSPEYVDGDLLELDAGTLASMRKEITRIDGAPRLPHGLNSIAQRGIMNRHRERQEAQNKLRDLISLWAGYYKNIGASDSEIYRRFYLRFNIDIMTAQTLGGHAVEELTHEIEMQLDLLGVKYD